MSRIYMLSPCTLVSARSDVRNIFTIMKRNCKRRKGNCYSIENESNEIYDKSSESNSDSAINNIYTRKKPIRRIKVLSTSPSEDDNIEDALPSTSFHNIQWTTKNAELTFHNFDLSNSGLQTENLQFSSTILHYFESFFSPDLVGFIVDKTNEYWARIVSDKTCRVKIGTTVDELYCFLACTLLMSRNKKLALREYWSKDKLLKSDIFSEIMCRDRYLVLLKMLHFSDDNQNSCDRLQKISSVSSRLQKSFKDLFYPFQNLCIHESLLLYKGKLSFKQYIPTKRSRFGIESYVLCDCKTGYVLDIVYTGSESHVTENMENIGKTGNIVLTLLKPYLGKGHSLYVDNYYSSPALFNLLHTNVTNACGTVKRRRKGMPVMDRKLEKGEVDFRTSSNLLALKWRDKTDVLMLSTFHTSEFISTGKRNYRTQEIVYKPKCIVDYNLSMGAVDKCDMVISSIKSIRKSIKWYKKYFFHLLDIAVWNSYCLYKYKTEKDISIAAFHLELVRQIFRKYHKNDVRHSGPKSADKYPLRLTGRHFPAIYTNEKTKRKSALRKCVVCIKNGVQRQSHYQCKTCDVGLCVYPCFQTYHTKLHY
nr:piggyBac transposable element-derived protein 4-like [Neodiprion pinetum]